MSQLKTKKIGQARKRSKDTDTYHHGDLRSTLLNTALRMLKTKHPNEISLRELAREAGVSQAAPYRHFKSKEEMFAVLGEQGFEIQARYMKEAWDRHRENPYDLYIQSGLSYFKMGEKHPQHFKLMFGTPMENKEDYPDFLKAASKSFAMLRKMVQECQKHGLIGPGDPYHKSLNCWSVVHGFTNLYTEGRFDWLGINSKNAEEALKVLLDQHLNGNKSEIKSENFTPLSTPESAFYKDLMNKLVE